MKFPQTNFPSADGRQEVLTRQRKLKMARLAHAYVRGNTGQFYTWLRSDQGRAVPQGPSIWICGDCHIGNPGPIADAQGKVEVQIRGLDETVIGNPAHDLIRLGLSLANAARGSDLPGVATARMIEQIMEGYEQVFVDLEERGKRIRRDGSGKERHAQRFVAQVAASLVERAKPVGVARRSIP